MGNVMFQVGSVDYTDNVIADEYSVSQDPQFKAWTDANGKQHRSVFRNKVSGSFIIWFETIDDYDSFCAQVENVRANDTSIPCTVWVNNKNTNATSDFYCEFSASRYRDGNFDDAVRQIQVNIEEC